VCLESIISTSLSRCIADATTQNPSSITISLSVPSPNKAHKADVDIDAVILLLNTLCYNSYGHSHMLKSGGRIRNRIIEIVSGQ
jgi:predicted nicotinamide N-methyase